MIDIIINIVLFLVGLYLGNRYAISRDKRKEFNEIADIVHLTLKREADNLTANGPNYNGPKDEEFELLKRSISFYEKNGLNQAIKRYKETKSANWETNGYNEVIIKDPKVIKEAIKDLQRYTTRRN